MAIKIRKEDALTYHEQGQPGKIEVVPTKMLSSQLDLALAYSPGVAEPCKEIAENPDNAYRYTSKGNLVGVISNGTAVLGLGNIGAAASKPVMEGKGVLFKKFAGIDCFDIEIDCQDPQQFIRIVKSLEPTFGGINLEDIKAPECFEIEETLRREMNIPLMHDDQHGTAIITSAALLNALELNGKKLEDLKLVGNGAGAAAIACVNLFVALGLRKENIILNDIKGVLTKDRTDLHPKQYAYATDQPVADLMAAMEGADVFLGLSAGNVLTADHIRRMAKDPIVFALANPDPEIAYDLAMASRPDIIMATGRSDHPNQVNNVLGFPYIFRGALDVRATEINEEMKLAAVRAIAELAKEPVPESVSRAYEERTLTFGKNYLIPKPLDPRLITIISPAVAKAAMDSGTARLPISDWNAYQLALEKRVGIDRKLMAKVIDRAKSNPKRVVFAEADTYKILKAAETLVDQNIAQPILLGERSKIEAIIRENSIELPNPQIIDVYREEERLTRYGNLLFERRKRKGVTAYEARKLMLDRNYFGAMMVETGEADALISGLTKEYSRIIRPALEVIGVESGINRVAGMYIIINKKQFYFFADTTVNVSPTADELVDIVGLTAQRVRSFEVEPRMAMLSYSNFGSNRGSLPERVIEATRKAKSKYPDLIIDGDIQANIALNQRLLQENYPFSELSPQGANTLIFPDLASGNIAYKLLQEIGNSEAIGPILMGMRKPVQVLQLGSSIRDIVNMVAIAVTEAQAAAGNVPVSHAPASMPTDS